SCRQTTSARCARSQSKTPLLAAERMPLALRLMMRMDPPERLLSDHNNPGRRQQRVYHGDHHAARSMAACLDPRLPARRIRARLPTRLHRTGLALAAATAIALADQRRRDLPWAYNRKEAKDHGEGGMLVGAPLVGRVLIVDDVMTAGTAVRESLALIRAHGAEPAGVLIALDWQERGQGEQSAAQEVATEHGIPVIAITCLDDVLDYAGEQPQLAAEHARLLAYRARYG